jgi:hypothetical protein
MFLTGAFATHRLDESFSKPVLDKNFCTSEIYAAY